MKMKTRYILRAITITTIFETLNKNGYSQLQQKILLLLIEEGPLSRKELANALNRPRTTIYDNLHKLLNKEIVKKFRKNNGSRGAPTTFWKLDSLKQF